MAVPNWLKPLKDLGSGILSYFWDEDEGVQYENIIPLLTAYGLYRAEDSDKLSKFFGLNTPMPTGYMGGIPDYTYERELVPNAFTSDERDNAGLMTLDAEEANIPRRPGSAGRRYFTDGIFSPTVAEEAGDSVCPPGSLRAGETIPAGSTESYCSQIHTPTDLCANSTYAAANPTICTAAAADTAESTTTGYTDAQIAAYVTYLQNLYGGGSGTDTAEIGGGLEGDQDSLGNTAGAGTTLAGGGRIAGFAGGGQPSASDIAKYQAAYMHHQAKLQNASTQKEKDLIEAFWQEHLVNYDPAAIAYAKRMYGTGDAAEGLRQYRKANAAPQASPNSHWQEHHSNEAVRAPVQRRRRGHAGGGLASLNPRGYYLGGRTDGLADGVPATIDQREPARLSDGEFVVPADVVSHLGNGSSNAGADQLFSMMDRVRKARTGRKSQGKRISPQRYLG